MFINKKNETNFNSKSQSGVFIKPTVQQKLKVGDSNDKYEQEANSVADKVVNQSNPDSALQKKEEEAIQEKTIANSIAPLVQKKEECDNCSQATAAEEDVKQEIDRDLVQEMDDEAVSQNVQKKEEEDVQAKKLQQPTNKTNANTFESRLNSKKGRGNPMDSSTKSRMEGSFGTTFNNVQIHNDSEAASMSDDINAQAFAHGQDVFFNKGKYKPGTNEGDLLLAHELTHTIQQNGAESEVKGNDMQLEQDANRTSFGLLQRMLTGVKTIGKDVLPRMKSGLRVSKCSKASNWGPGTVHETRNLATIALGGDAPITWHMLNGSKMTSEAVAKGAIKTPTITTRQDGATWKSKVTGVPKNHGSFDETVLSPGPWTRMVPKATIAANFGIACAGAGNTNFRAKGDPSDNAVYAANRRHEDHHASDHHAAFSDTIGKWEAKLTKAHGSGTEYAGASEAESKTNLWAAMGGTSDQVAVNYHDEGYSRGAAFHKTAKGGPMSLARPGADKTCANSWVYVTNPS